MKWVSRMQCVVLESKGLIRSFYVISSTDNASQKRGCTYMCVFGSVFTLSGERAMAHKRNISNSRGVTQRLLMMSVCQTHTHM